MAASPTITSCDDSLRSPVSGIAFDVEISACNVAPLSIPKRVRRRLLETAENASRSPASLQDIEAKLKEAESRRQRFHEWLANKARPRIRSISRSSKSLNLAQRLQAKLVAAEQKRLELLALEQTRLAKSHELRAAARTEVQLRAEREREELESKVESRVQQAETNRLALLEAEKQKRSAAHQRVAQSIMQRTTQECKDWERVEALRALICQKIAAAQEKRASLLTAERTRAQALVLQATRVAKAVSRKRELESRNKKELLEARLQRAKRRRAEFLEQRGGCQGTCHDNRHKMRKHGDRLCRKLTSCWRRFRHSRRTTLMLTRDFAACNVNQQSVTSLPFEELAALITSSTSLRAVKALLARLESRFLLSSASTSNVAKIDQLLRRLSPPNKRVGVGNGVRGGCKSNMQGSTTEAQKSAGAVNGKDCQEKEMNRYPARVFLCAYMVIGHPEAVFSSQGERENALSEAALKLVHEFEALVSTILDGPSSISQTGPSSPSFVGDKKLTWDAATRPFAAQLSAFDTAWCSYLYQFVAWKVQDAQLLEEDLIRVACQLELSMLQKCNILSNDIAADASHDSQAIRNQVLQDQQLLRERVSHLTSSAGVARMDKALSEVRTQFLEDREKKIPLLSPFASPQKPKSCASSVVLSSELNEGSGGANLPKSVLMNSINQVKETGKGSVQHSAFFLGSEPSITDDEKGIDNERLVNEMLHEPNRSISDLHLGACRSKGKLGELQAQIKRTIEDAFWNGVLESLTNDPPDYCWIIKLLKDMRTELDNIVPDNWKQELQESLDIEIFSQVLQSGNHDYDYFQRLLDYALGIVLKLGAPARDNDTRASHQALLQELAQTSLRDDKNESSFGLTLVKGLRFVLEQIQVLKADISVTHIQAVAPIIQGAAGVEYLQKAFVKRYELLGLPSSEETDVLVKLPKTVEWLMEVGQTLDQDREELEASRAAYESTGDTKGISKGQVSPLPSMRTGVKIVDGEPPAVPRESPTSVTGIQEQRVLHYRSTDTFVRLGLLHIISDTQAVTEDRVPETFKLNIHKLRKAQNDFQRIVIMATGLLLLRQNVTERGLYGAELDDIMRSGSEKLDTALNDSGITIPEIGLLLAKVASTCTDPPDADVATNADLLTRVLHRSLSPDDAVFKRVSATVRMGLRVVILLGKGPEGLVLVNAALQRIGAPHLKDSVVTLGNDLERLASVSCTVHGPWYAHIISSY